MVIENIEKLYGMTFDNLDEKINDFYLYQK